MHGAWAHTPAQAQAKLNDPRLDFFLMNQVKSYIAIIKTRVNQTDIRQIFSAEIQLCNK